MRKRKTTKARTTPAPIKPTVPRKPRKRKTSVEQRLAVAYNAISSIRALDNLRTALAGYGYTPQHFEQGETLYQLASTHDREQQSAYSSLRYANSTLRSTERTVQELYMRHVQLARLALTNDTSALEALDLNGQRKSSFAGWTEQAQQLYAGGLADSAIQAKLAVYGLDASKLTEGSQQIDTLIARLAERDEAREAAKQATSTRNTAFTDLDDWMRRLKLIGGIALREHPWMLKQIGIRVKR